MDGSSLGFAYLSIRMALRREIYRKDREVLRSEEHEEVIQKQTRQPVALETNVQTLETTRMRTFNEIV